MSEAPLKLRPAQPAAPCKVCLTPSPVIGAIDFNRTCEVARGARWERSGVDVAYRRCPRCGLIFTDAFDDWSEAEFLRHIYNDGYPEVDPDMAEVRPDANVRTVVEAFGPSLPALRVLDYGGGAGRFAEGLRAAGAPTAATYDPFYGEYRQRPEGRFDLITCFETLEHMPDPLAGAAEIESLLGDEGLVVMSTLTQPRDIGDRPLDWWYLAPRNGHVTVFTHAGLAALWGRVGLRYGAVSDNLHVAYRTPPAFAKHLFGGA